MAQLKTLEDIGSSLLARMPGGIEARFRSRLPAAAACGLGDRRPAHASPPGRCGASATGTRTAGALPAVRPSSRQVVTDVSPSAPRPRFVRQAYRSAPLNVRSTPAPRSAVAGAVGEAYRSADTAQDARGLRDTRRRCPADRISARPGRPRRRPPQHQTVASARRADAATPDNPIAARKSSAAGRFGFERPMLTSTARVRAHHRRSAPALSIQGCRRDRTPAR